jgi:hypothetical protein
MPIDRTVEKSAAASEPDPARRRRLRFMVVLAVNAGLLVLAFVLAPRSCEGGFEIYLGCGVADLVAMLALPFVVRRGSSLVACMGWSLGFVLFGAAVWVAGLLVANVRFLCRLF